jgi:hypothetical protein
MPLTFTNLDDARKWRLIVLSRSVHFIHSASSSFANAEDGGLVREGNISEQVMRSSAGTRIPLSMYEDNIGVDLGVARYRSYPSVPMSLNIQTERERYIGEISRQQAAFSPLLESLEQKLRPGAAVLQIHTITTKLYLNILTTMEECAFDECLP